MGFHREFLVAFVILVSVSVCRVESNRSIQSERGSALVLPLVESKRSGANVDRRFSEGRRGLEYEAEWQDARMTLHDDLLTKGCISRHNSQKFAQFDYNPIN